MPTKRATIYEVADHAGVSHQTVSRYLRHNGGLKPATLARVEAAIAELNYRPNRIARSMRTRRTGRLAIVLPGAIQFLPLRLLTAAATVAHDAGYAVDLVALEGDAATRSERADELTDSGEFEGILALASWGPQASDDSSTAVVTVADYDESMRGIGALADARACGDVVRHLADLGHRSLLHLTRRPRVHLGPEPPPDLPRHRGRAGPARSGDRRRLAGRDRVPGGAGLPDDTDVTAIVAANDKVAMGAIRGCLQRGWRVPDDVSVFGWDDEELGRYATPTLSTVTIDLERQGAQAMRRLLALVRGEQPPEPETSSLHTLIPRESSGPAPLPGCPRRSGAWPPGSPPVCRRSSTLCRSDRPAGCWRSAADRGRRPRGRRATPHRAGAGHRPLGHRDRPGRRGSAAEIASGRMSVRCVAAEDLVLDDGEEPYDLVFAIRVGALDGRHPAAGIHALQRIAAVTTRTHGCSWTAATRSARSSSRGATGRDHGPTGGRRRRRRRLATRQGPGHLVRGRPRHVRDDLRRTGRRAHRRAAGGHRRRRRRRLPARPTPRHLPRRRSGDLGRGGDGRRGTARRRCRPRADGGRRGSGAHERRARTWRWPPAGRRTSTPPSATGNPLPTSRRRSAIPELAGGSGRAGRVVDLTDQLLDDVLQEQDPGHPALAVDRPGDVRSAAPHRREAVLQVGIPQHGGQSPDPLGGERLARGPRRRTGPSRP